MNWTLLVYLAQVQEAMGVFGILLLLGALFLGFMCLMAQTHDDDNVVNTVKPWCKRVLVTAAIFCAFGLLLPSQQTVIAWAAFDYGPEYMDRVLAMLEGFNQ